MLLRRCLPGHRSIEYLLLSCVRVGVDRARRGSRANDQHLGTEERWNI